MEKTPIWKRADLTENKIAQEVTASAEGVQTRSQRPQRKETEVGGNYYGAAIMAEQDHVPGTEGISESNLKRRKEIEMEETGELYSQKQINEGDSMHIAMVNEKSDERGLRVYGPIVSTESVLSKWAWGTGSAEEYPDDKREEAWLARGPWDESESEFHPEEGIVGKGGNMPDVGQITGVAAQSHLLHFHIWPGPVEISLPPNEIFGWDSKMRRGYLEEMCCTRLRIYDIQREILHDDDGIDARMHQDVKYWWDYIQENRMWWKLQKSLKAFAHDPRTEQMGDAEFQLKYEQMLSDYTTRSSDFELPAYDEDEAHRAHLHKFDVVGYDVMGQELYNSPALAQVFAHGIPYGLRHAPTVYRRQIEAQIVRQSAPDWIVPPEGDNGGAGIAPTFDQGAQDNPDMDVAGLPIPEGCLDRGPFRSGRYVERMD